MRADLKKFLSSAKKKPLYLESTGWLNADSFDFLDELDSIYAKFKSKFNDQKKDLIRSLGKPVRVLPKDMSWFDDWYPEAMQAAVWRISNDKAICLAVEHHDKET